MNVDNNRVGIFFNPSHNTPKQIPYLAHIMRKNNTKWSGQVINQMVKKKPFPYGAKNKYVILKILVWNFIIYSNVYNEHC
jgi:hypothetical protein